MRLMFYLNVFYLPSLKDFVGHYKLWNEVMFWFTQLMYFNVYMPLLIKPDMSRDAGYEIYALFDKHHKESYSLYSISCESGWVYRYIYNLYIFFYFMLYRAH